MYGANMPTKTILRSVVHRALGASEYFLCWRVIAADVTTEIALELRLEGALIAREVTLLVAAVTACRIAARHY